MQNNPNASGDWTLDNIPFDAIEREKVVAREDLFYLVTAASFIEIAADLYTDNLAEYFEDDFEILTWLRSQWSVEEVRHGFALRAYVRHVWPEFDWDAANSAFIADYSRRCNLGQLEATRSLEMLARCVVETGTTTFYQALAMQTDEPVLAGIASRMRSDEVNHYKHFYRYFQKYDGIAPVGRLKVVGAFTRRLFEARNDDAECAL